MCECGHKVEDHFRFDGARSRCRVRADGTLANGGSECECPCERATGAQ